MRCRCDMTNVLETCRNEKHGLLPNSFFHHCAESNLGSGKMPNRWVKSCEWTVARFRVSGHTENKWPKQQQKRSRNSKVTHSCEQWTEIEAGKLNGPYRQISETQWYFLYLKEYISLTEKRALYTKMVSSLSGKSTYHTWSKTQCNIFL